MSRIIRSIFGDAADDAARRRVQLHNVARYAVRAAVDFRKAGDIASAEANEQIAMDLLEAARCRR